LQQPVWWSSTMSKGSLGAGYTLLNGETPQRSP
jgi:hypothetical protein